MRLRRMGDEHDADRDQDDRAEGALGGDPRQQPVAARRRSSSPLHPWMIPLQAAEG